MVDGQQQRKFPLWRGLDPPLSARGSVFSDIENIRDLEAIAWTEIHHGDGGGFECVLDLRHV
ncbi:MAG: hypothetical protein LCH56_10835 [Proteobacteria bacterium]|nr:hypothetical protein [Pseudomonadota bacterium]